MNIQEYIIDDNGSFEPKHIFECGQCFRWNSQADGSYIGVFNNNVISVKKQNNKIIFRGICKENIKDICREYFDLERDYSQIKKKLEMIDEFLKKSIEYGNGIRILNQNLWECIISFIISANNNIPRIKKIIEKLSSEYGDKICYEGKDYFTFPTPEQLSRATVEDLRTLGLGFRDVRVYNTTKMILEKQVDLEKLEALNNSESIREELLRLDGVGPKVADCIMLFSTLKRLDVFPIDVWVRRVMNELYIKAEDETKINKKEITKLAESKYKDLAGIAQQYLFYWKREA